MPPNVRVEWTPGPVTRMVESKVEEALDDAAGDLRDEVHRLIDEPGHGLASEPGESPHLQTGELYESIEIRRTKDGRLVGSPLTKAFWLERGESELEPRPFLRSALANVKRIMVKRFKE